MLSKFWSPYEERCGFILKDGTVVEVPNIHPEPKRYFQISQEEIDKHLPEIYAFWHSHSDNNLNLSLADYFSFIAFPNHRHRIYNKENQYAEYYVRRGFVMRELL